MPLPDTPGPHTESAAHNRAYAWYTEWVPTAVIAMFREYRRTCGKCGKYTLEQWQRLRQDIAENGIRDPTSSSTILRTAPPSSGKETAARDR